MKSRVLILALGVLGMSACGVPDGTYTGIATVHQGADKSEDHVLMRMLKSSAPSKADLYLEGGGLPCGELPLKGSGSTYKLKGVVDCQNTSRNAGSTTTSTTSYSVTDVEVTMTGKSAVINARYTYRSSAGSTTDYIFDFDGERAASN